MKDLFFLDPAITFLNHGSYGACPKPIFKVYQDFQLELETQPVSFIKQKTEPYLLNAKKALATYIGCDKEDFFFTQNPTSAVNTITHSLKLQAGDEILATDNEYGAMNMTWNFFCKKTGAKYVRQPITLPIQSKEQFLEEFWKGYSDRTKVVFINHMSSATALIFPVKEIIEKAKTLGLITIIDGAHVPGHIDLDIRDLDPDYYTGTLHKWMLAPKGSTFFYVKKALQDSLDPLVVSWGYETKEPTKSQFLENNEQQGTRDISAFLSTPAVIHFLEEHNWKQQSSICKQIVRDNYQRFCDLLGTQPLCPISTEFLGQMASVEINTNAPLALKQTLINDYNIEIPIMPLNGKNYIRYSINAYNSQADLDRLYEVLEEIMAQTDLITR
jgi:isopenicillin-N epimerase